MSESVRVKELNKYWVGVGQWKWALDIAKLYHSHMLIHDTNRQQLSIP